MSEFITQEHQSPPISWGRWLLAVLLMAAAVAVGVLLAGFTVDHLLAGIARPDGWMWR
jgi:hypothetical protein